MKQHIQESTINWLLEKENPGVRYLTMRDLLKLPGDDPELIKAQEIAHREGPIATILDAMHPEGYWEEPGPGYLPKYRSTVWSIILLGQLGASIDMEERIRIACQYAFRIFFCYFFCCLRHHLLPYPERSSRTR